MPLASGSPGLQDVRAHHEPPGNRENSSVKVTFPKQQATKKRGLAVIHTESRDATELGETRRMATQHIVGLLEGIISPVIVRDAPDTPTITGKMPTGHTRRIMRAPGEPAMEKKKKKKKKKTFFSCCFGSVFGEPGLARWDLLRTTACRRCGESAILPVIVGVSGASRTMTGEMIQRNRPTMCWGGHSACLTQLGGVPRLGVYDGEPTFCVAPFGKVTFTEEFSRVAGEARDADIHLQARRSRSQRHGRTTRMRDLATSFLPGRAFVSPADFNGQMHESITDRANVRVHKTLHARPIDLIDEDTASDAAVAVTDAGCVVANAGPFGAGITGSVMQRTTFGASTCGRPACRGPR